MPLRTTDIADGDIIDAFELKSDGLAADFEYKQSVTIVSVTSSTKTVIISGWSLRDPDNPTEPADIVEIKGNDAAGTYVLATVVDDVTFTVVEAIPDATGGTADFRHPAGATKIGLNPTGLANVTATTVQGAVAELDSAITSGGITAEAHKTLRQLIHLADGGGPFEGFTSGAYKETLPSADPFPTSVIWWTSSGKTIKIVEKTITYNSNKTPSTITWKAYDAVGTLLVTLVDTISYSGVFETSRTRTWS